VRKWLARSAFAEQHEHAHTAFSIVRCSDWTSKRPAKLQTHLCPRLRILSHCRPRRCLSRLKLMLGQSGEASWTATGGRHRRQQRPRVPPPRRQRERACRLRSQQRQPAWQAAARACHRHQNDEHQLRGTSACAELQLTRKGGLLVSARPASRPSSRCALSRHR
jgi:hypothetical protein